MKKTFAVLVFIDGQFQGDVDIDDFGKRVEMPDGHIFGGATGTRVKVCNIEIELPFDSVESVINSARSTEAALQLAKIKEKELELKQMREAFFKVGQTAA